VLLPAPGVVQVTVGRNVQNVYGYYLATSGDGGATFGAPLRIGGAFAKRAALLPGGLIAAEGDDVRQLGGAVLRPDGSDAAVDAPALDERAQFSDVTVQGSDVYIAGSLAGPTTAARLPAGANSSDPAAWQRLPDLNSGSSPELAPGPAGPVVLIDPLKPGDPAPFVHDERADRGRLPVHRVRARRGHVRARAPARLRPELPGRRAADRQVDALHEEGHQGAESASPARSRMRCSTITTATTRIGIA
jgi:hypothetical protein